MNAHSDTLKKIYGELHCFSAHISENVYIIKASDVDAFQKTSNAF